jgi:hypothetical protein
MATPRELLDQIKQRTWVLMIAAGGDLDYHTAQKAAAQEVRAQERSRKRSAAAPHHPYPTPGEVTPHNARKWLLDKLSEISQRLKASVHLADEPTPQIRKHVEDPEGYLQDCGNAPPRGGAPTANNGSYAKPEPPPDQLVGGFIVGTGVSTSERIPDSEFHTSVQSPVTQAWRRSLEQAERNEARKRSRWVG